jgi:hypothetical protein
VKVKVIQNLTFYLKKYLNTVHQDKVMSTFKFWNTKFSDYESFDLFVSELKSRASSCNFADVDRTLRDKIVFSIPSQQQEILLRDKDLTFGKAIDLCQSYFLSARQVKEIAGDVESIHKVRKFQKENPRSMQKYKTKGTYNLNSSEKINHL